MRWRIWLTSPDSKPTMENGLKFYNSLLSRSVSQFTSQSLGSCIGHNWSLNSTAGSSATVKNGLAVGEGQYRNATAHIHLMVRPLFDQVLSTLGWEFSVYLASARRRTRDFGSHQTSPRNTPRSKVPTNNATFANAFGAITILAGTFIIQMMQYSQIGEFWLLVCKDHLTLVK